MTAFVLVGEVWTGGWLWQEVAARLREAGCEVHPATLTGLGDLDAQVGELVRLIDQVDAPELVIVGHGMGIHPVLGAADRRPERISRIVYLDAGLPQDGESVLDLLPDPAVRDRLLKQAAQAEDGRVPAPTADEWPGWGSTAGVSADALARLVRMAAPQPLATLTQPLRLTGASATLPTTGVLCTGNGVSIAIVQAVASMGNPRFQPLTDPRVGFFELATGHWPMLSAPDELAEVLQQAAAGAGHRLTPKAAEAPRPGFLLDVAERARERVGNVDLYLPDAGEPRPAVVFVHGGPVPANVEPTPRDWPTLVGYGRYVASLGAVGVTLDHRLHGLGDYARAAEDVAAAVDLVRADPRVDPDRIALWFFSGGGLLSADWLAAPPPWLRCLAATYPVLAPLPGWGLGESRFRPAAAVRTAGQLPIVLTRVGLETPELAATVEEFLTAAEEAGANTEVIDVPQGRHGFEGMEHPEQARDAVQQAVRSVLGHVRS